MARCDFVAVLFIRNVTLQVWNVSPGPGLIHASGGRHVDMPGLPGMLFDFPSSRAAAQAALRINGETENYWGPMGVPPMSIDVGNDAGTAARLSLEVPKKVIAVTTRAARELATEPIEILPGPSIQTQGSVVIPTMFLPANTMNIGWALPLIQTASATGASPHFAANSPYLRKTEPAVINIQMTSKSKFELPFALPGKFFFICIVSFVLLFALYRQTQRRILQRRNLETQTNTETIPFPSRLTKEDSLLIPPSVSTPAPLGYGTVVVETEPTDAKVYVNEELKGKKSPVILEKQANQDMFKLTVRRKGYKEYTKIYNVEANRKEVLTVKLEKEPK